MRDNKTKQVEVSIIVPVYNVELYLKQALDSLINQTFKNIEIIIVNDGSTDKSLEIAKIYKKKDERIQIINQENQGLSGARNTGKKIAKGKYIYFMDSDDYIEINTIEKCYQECKKNDLDFIFFDALNFTNDNIKISQDNFNRDGLGNLSIKKGKEYLRLLLDKNLYTSSVCLCFIKLEFLKKLKLKFFHGILHEDELFTFLLYINASKVKYLNEKFFKRRVRYNSITTSKISERNVIGNLTVAIELRKEMLKNNLTEQNLFDSRIQRMLGNAISNSSYLNKSLKEKYIQDIKDNFGDYLNFKNRVKIKTIGIYKILKYLREKL